MKRLFITLFTLLSISNAHAVEPLAQAKEELKAARFDTAAATLLHLVGEEPSNYEAWFLLGVAQVQQQSYPQAIESFQQVVTLQPTLAEPHNNLAAVYNNLGDTNAAVRELELALSKKPNYTIAEENLADLYIKLALKHYQSILNQEANPIIEQRYTRLLQVRSPSNSDNSAETATTAAPAAHIVPTASSTENAVAATAQPAAEPAAVATVAADQNITGVLDALMAWRKAWSAKDVTGFFQAYADDYTPDSRFASLADWKAYKKRVIEKKAFIKVSFEQVEANMLPDNKRATVNMLQLFESDTYKGKDFKKVTLKYTPQGWKIDSEVAIQ